MSEPCYRAKAILTLEFDVWNCTTLEQAEKQANDLAIDFVQCIPYSNDLEIQTVEVEAVNQ